MGMQFETFGNAIVQFSEDGKPVLTTDPWLVGTCYFGSWGLERPLTDEQIRRVQESPFVWISHGHPDHLHPESLDLLSPQRTRMLLPDHYDREIHATLTARGFDVTILPFKKWVRLSDRLRVMCLDNENQDGILVVEAGDALVVNLNDSPLCGEGYFLRRLIRRHASSRSGERAHRPKAEQRAESPKTFLLGLCSIDADMLNVVDENGRLVAGPPDERKRGAIWDVAAKAAALGAKYWCCSSSQHRYVREDSIWANPYRIDWSDMRRHWTRPEVTLVEPYVTVDLDTCAITRNAVDPAPAAGGPLGTGPDDWSARLTPEEWTRVEQFIRKFEIIQDRIDFIEFAVGGESRRVYLAERAEARPQPHRGIVFHVPKHSLLETVEYGYFDDLLIGNFMKTRLVNTKLYPDFSKQVAKIGGNAKVFTKAQHRAFVRRYFRRSPRAFAGTRVEELWRYRLLPAARDAAASIGVKPALKLIYRRYIRKEPVGATA